MILLYASTFLAFYLSIQADDSAWEEEEDSGEWLQDVAEV